jgi:hypothetical protein
MVLPARLPVKENRFELCEAFGDKIRINRRTPLMPDAEKTYIVNDQPTDRDALDFTPYVGSSRPAHLQ